MYVFLQLSTSVPLILDLGQGHITTASDTTQAAAVNASVTITYECDRASQQYQ